MSFPSGSGSERIKYSKLTALTNTGQALITGVSLHIYTIVSIIVCETGAQSGDKVSMFLADSDGSSNPNHIFMKQSVPADSTYVWNDRFSFDGNKKLIMLTTSTANMDVICTYIDQDWS